MAEDVAPDIRGDLDTGHIEGIFLYVAEDKSADTDSEDTEQDALERRDISVADHIIDDLLCQLRREHVKRHADNQTEYSQQISGQVLFYVCRYFFHKSSFIRNRMHKKSLRQKPQAVIAKHMVSSQVIIRMNHSM